VEAGAKAVKSAADVTNASDVIITILADAAAIEHVYHGAGGLLAGGTSGKLFIEMSTELPSVKISLAEKIRAKGAAMIDCPVGGSVNPARQGKLLGLVSGDAADIARARPILEQLCGQRLEDCGPVGAGSAAKLAINLPLMVAWQAYGEAFSIARSVGWEPKRLLDLFCESNGANNGLKTRAEMIVKMLEGKDPGPTSFSIANGVKDLRTMIDTGEALGADMRVTKAALSTFEDATKAGIGGGDGAQMTVFWSDKKK
jgi:3-hydroxyisobutyrate dehydrogenase